MLNKSCIFTVQQFASSDSAKTDYSNIHQDSALLKYSIIQGDESFECLQYHRQ